MDPHQAGHNSYEVWNAGRNPYDTWDADRLRHAFMQQKEVLASARESGYWVVAFAVAAMLFLGAGGMELQQSGLHTRTLALLGAGIAGFLPVYLHYRRAKACGEKLVLMTWALENKGQ